MIFSLHQISYLCFSSEVVFCSSSDLSEMSHSSMSLTFSLFGLKSPSWILSHFRAGEATTTASFFLNMESFVSASPADGVHSAVSFTKTLGSFSFDHVLYK